MGGSTTKQRKWGRTWALGPPIPAGLCRNQPAFQHLRCKANQEGSYHSSLLCPSMQPGEWSSSPSAFRPFCWSGPALSGRRCATGKPDVRGTASFPLRPGIANGRARRLFIHWRREGAAHGHALLSGNGVDGDVNPPAFVSCNQHCPEFLQVREIWAAAKHRPRPGGAYLLHTLFLTSTSASNPPCPPVVRQDGT